MATQWLCGATDEGIDGSKTRNRLQEALEDAANQLSANTQHDFYAYGPDNHDWVCPKLDYTDDPDKYLSDWFSQELDKADGNGDITVMENDIWILVDGSDKLGYGDGGFIANDFTNNVFLGRAISLQKTWFAPDPNELTKKIIKHNIGHCYWADHEQGDISVNSDDVTDATPMAWGYVRVKNGDSYVSDSCIKGDDTPPDTFNACAYSKFNYIDGPNFPCGCTDASLCRHSLKYNNCTTEQIEDVVSNKRT